MSARPPFKLLFVCRHNAVRSQVAQVLANKIGEGKVEAVSAGPEPTEVPDYIHDWAETVNGQHHTLKSKPLDSMADLPFDMIITLCDKSHAALPELASDQAHIRWDFHHPDNGYSLRHLEMELADRIRLMLLARHIL